MINIWLNKRIVQSTALKGQALILESTISNFNLAISTIARDKFDIKSDLQSSIITMIQCLSKRQTRN